MSGCPPGSSPRAHASRARHPDHLHHGASRSVAASTPHCRRRGGVLVQTVQRHRLSRRAHRSAGDEAIMMSDASSRMEVGTMSEVTATVFVVDDDISVRESLELLIRMAGWEPETFESARDFLSHRATPRPVVWSST